MNRSGLAGKRISLQAKYRHLARFLALSCPVNLPKGKFSGASHLSHQPTSPASQRSSASKPRVKESWLRPKWVRKTPPLLRQSGGSRICLLAVTTSLSLKKGIPFRKVGQGPSQSRPDSPQASAMSMNCLKSTWIEIPRHCLCWGVRLQVPAEFVATVQLSQVAEDSSDRPHQERPDP